MLCPKCGYYTENEENVCPSCGAILRHESGFRMEGAQAIRQGKRAREAAKSRPAPKTDTEEQRRRRSGASHATIEMPAVEDTRTDDDGYSAVYPISEEAEKDGAPVIERRRRAVYDDSMDQEQAQKYLAAHSGDKRSRRRMVNWVKVTIIGFSVAAALLILAAAFLTLTDTGQDILAYWSQKGPKILKKISVSSASLWRVGDKMMNEGRIDEAITFFEKAKEQDEKSSVVDVDGLLMLGNAYEAAGKTEEAANLYKAIYDETPSRSEAYVAHIRLLQNSGLEEDLVKAGELMKLAYEKTGETTFQTQRRDLLPAPPEVDLTAAYYETKKHITISSYQGFDVYYTFSDSAELPYGGTKFTTPIELDEGIWNLRAVAVNGKLVSDELRGTYKIIMPSPQTPQANLAPKTYKTRQQVRLKPGKDNINDDDIVIYYTIDGSNPDKDSPIYTGDPIQLPNGWVTLKAVAVNRYSKMSNMLEIKYKIEANPKPKTAFTAEDTLGKLKLGSTTQLEFMETYGEGKAAGAIEVDGFETECRKYEYPWGYAIMNLAKKTWVVVEVSFKSSGVFMAPRGTGIDDEATHVTNQFKDMGQVESASGNRGLYANDKGSGKIWDLGNEGKSIRYDYTYDGHWLKLEYSVGTNGRVQSIRMYYIP